RGLVRAWGPSSLRGASPAGRQERAPRVGAAVSSCSFLARRSGSRHLARGTSLAHWSAAAPSGSRRLVVLVPRTPFRLPSSRSGHLAGALVGCCPEWEPPSRRAR